MVTGQSVALVQCNIIDVCSDVTQDKSQGMKDTVEKVSKLMGEARNYGTYTEW